MVAWVRKQYFSSTLLVASASHTIQLSKQVDLLKKKYVTKIKRQFSNFPKNDIVSLDTTSIYQND